MNRNQWTFAAIAVLSLLLLGELGRNLGNPSHTTAPTSGGSQGSNSNVRTAVSSQDADGINQEQMDQTFLNNLEGYTRRRIVELARQYLAANGQPDASINVDSEAVYIEAGGKKLAVIRIRDSRSNQVLVHGIIGDQLTRVLCVRETPNRIPVTYGACGDQVRETFGVDLRSVSNR